MNWEAIGAIGELLGAAGVIVSLLYVASQLRQHRVAMRTASSVEYAASFRALTEPAMGSPQLTALLLRGFDNPDSLDDDERAWVINVVFNALRVFETLHFQYESGTVDRELFRGYAQHLQAYLDAPICRQYWAMRRGFFSARFQEYVESLFEASSEPGVRAPEVVRRMGDRGRGLPPDGETTASTA